MGMYDELDIPEVEGVQVKCWWNALKEVHIGDLVPSIDIYNTYYVRVSVDPQHLLFVCNQKVMGIIDELPLYSGQDCFPMFDKYGNEITVVLDVDEEEDA